MLRYRQLMIVQYETFVLLEYGKNTMHIGIPVIQFITQVIVSGYMVVCDVLVHLGRQKTECVSNADQTQKYLSFDKWQLYM